MKNNDSQDIGAKELAWVKAVRWERAWRKNREIRGKGGECGKGWN